MLSFLRRISGDHSDPNDPANVTVADISTPFVATPTEEATLIAHLRQIATDANQPAVAQADDFWLLAAIRARKGDTHRALSLMKNYIEWKRASSAEKLSLAKSEQMQMLLKRQIILVAGNVDRDGRPVINVRARNTAPSLFDPLDVVRALFFVMEWTLRTYPAAQTHGIVLVNDMTGVVRSNFDLRLPGLMQKALGRTLPVRVAAITLLSPPFVFKTIMWFVLAFAGEKIRARVQICEKEDTHVLDELYERDQMMEYLDVGGSFEWNDALHEEWLERMTRDCQTWAQVTTYQEGSLS